MCVCVCVFVCVCVCVCVAAIWHMVNLGRALSAVETVIMLSLSPLCIQSGQLEYKQQTCIILYLQGHIHLEISGGYWQQLCMCMLIYF